MSRKLILAGILMLFAVYPIGYSYAIQIAGDCWGTWDSSMNPIEVVGNLRVPPNSTLIIQPGCRIIFQGYYRFIVDTSASLQAIGNRGDSIYFTASNNNQGWHGLKFLNSGEGCQISYCVFEWGRASGADGAYIDYNGGAVYGYNSSFSINNSSFIHNYAREGCGGAVYASGCTLSVSDCNISFNKCAFGGSGIYSAGGATSIIDNIFYTDSTWYPLGGEFGGAMALWNTNLTMIGNKIYDCFSGNSGGGALIIGCNSIITNNVFLNNIALDNGGGVNVHSTSSLNVVAYNLFKRNIVPFTNSYGGGGDFYWRQRFPYK